MKLKQMQAARLYETLRTQSRKNMTQAKQAIKQYHDGQANENRTIKILTRIFEEETMCVKRMTAIVNKYFPDYKNPKADEVLIYIAQFI
jgi:type II secretory pathway predicted ATPase ExeA